MSDQFEVSKTNKVRQIKRRAHYDKEAVYSVIDAGLVAHVAFMQDENPVVVPMIYGRSGDTLYLHGARKARIIRMLEQTDRACVNITLLDGIVLARSSFNSSMQYRSATVFGKPALIDDHDEKLAAMYCISEQSMPGRWDELRDSHEREVKMTGVIALDIETGSAKISDEGPNDDEEDYEIPIWAGVLPISMTSGELLTDERVLPDVEASPTITRLQNHKY